MYSVVPNKRGCGNKCGGGLENILKINNWRGWNKRGGGETLHFEEQLPKFFPILVSL